jgi:hypothetical protein
MQELYALYLACAVLLPEHAPVFMPQASHLDATKTELQATKPSCRGLLAELRCLQGYLPARRSRPSPIWTGPEIIPGDDARTTIIAETADGEAK